MNKNVNTVAIGMFVLGASIIAVVAVMVFGAAKFFTKSEMFISFFSESVNGLDVGAPVKFKGVTIGKVEKIMIGSADQMKNKSAVTIIYSINLDQLRRKSQKDLETVANFDVWMKEQIEDGLRAKLNYQSIVTGMLYIELDFLAQENDKYKLKYRGNKDYIEMPSVQTGMAEMAKTIEKTIKQVSKIDFEQIGADVESILANVDDIVGDPYTKNAPKRLDTLLANSDALVGNLNNFVKSDSVAKMPENVNVFLTDSSKLVKTASANLETLSNSTNATLSNLNGVLKNLDSIVAPQSPMRYELAHMMRSINDALNSITNLTDYLERNPSSLLTGKLQNSKKNENE